MLCMPDHPELSNITEASGDSNIYGSEYNDGNFHAAHDEDVPCALCMSTNTSTTVMIPARKTCFPGWKEEYRGIIVSGAFSHNPSMFICLDANPEFVPGGHRSNDDHLLYITRMKCGSLSCPPYKDNLQVYCVVCSK